jgi:maltose phosphorylase
MAKIAERYLQLHPWEVTEEGFHTERARVSESIFSLANEFMGVRGYFEEGYSGDKLIGSYVNGIFEEKKVVHASYFNGFATRFCFMVNTLDWLYTRITLDGEKLDLAKSKFTAFKRTLDMRKGVLTREFVWETQSGKLLKIIFERFLSMVNPNSGFQKVTFKPINFSGKVNVEAGLDFSPVHELEEKNFWTEVKSGTDDGLYAMLCSTETSRQQLYSSFKVNTGTPVDRHLVEDDKYIGIKFELDLKEGTENYFEKTVVNHAERKKGISPEKVWNAGMELARRYMEISFSNAFERQVEYWKSAWEKLDISIEGDEENQQGVRFCIFNLQQTYHGNDPTLNVGAKGLTGEYYYGWTWWDTETYCLPFYMFSNPKASRSLLEYRYNTLPQALERAKEMDCEGSCYPMGTIDGTESCSTWQHGNLEIHVSAAIPYGIWHYNQVCRDKNFLYEKGFEMLIQASRYFASRGGWGSVTGKYGYFGVMGPDEFHMMVNNNCYTNLLAKKTFEFTLEVMENIKKENPAKYNEILAKVNLAEGEPNDWKNKADNMYIPFDEKTGLFEQHEGYFNLPYTDVKAIPHTQFPIYKNWEYGRIFRTSMTKQPDVLLFLFFYSQQYNMDIKQANYEYYEPRCSHESSLSPAIHSILACELGKFDQALDFSQYSSRLDLDDYNRNAHEGLHITSMAGTWMNIVYGFGGMRSDGDILVFNPSLPKAWKSYSFKIFYNDSVLQVNVKEDKVCFKTMDEGVIELKIYDKVYCVDTSGVEVELIKA